jgi:hypothetical protein
MEPVANAIREKGDLTSTVGERANSNVITVVDQIATKEGVPAGFDPEINNVINSEVDKL